MTRSDARARFDVDKLDNVDNFDEYWTAILDNRGVDGDVWTCPHDAVDAETCPFHGDAQAVDDEQQVEVLVRTLAGVEQRGRDGGERRNQFVGATFGDLDLSGADLSLPGDARLDFLGATFAGEADFEACSLAAPTFAHATFEACVCLDDATFRGRTFFDQARFAEKARFVGATFEGAASFDGAEFEARTELIRVAFESDVSFDDIDCAGEITLYESTVDGDLSLMDWMCYERVMLSDTRVGGDLSLMDWTSYERVVLSDTRVDGRLAVERCQFYRDEADADVDITDASPPDWYADSDPIQFDGVECDFFALVDCACFLPVDCSNVTVETLFLNDSQFLDAVNLTDARIATFGTRTTWFGERLRVVNARVETSEFERTVFDGDFAAHRARLTDTSFPGSELQTARFENANLSGADLSGLDLRGPVRFRFANLSRADLSNLDLRGADLSSTTLNRAVLHGTDLRGADISAAALEGVHIDDDTQFLHPPVGEFDETHLIPSGIRTAIPFVPTGGSYCGPDPEFDPPAVKDREVDWPEVNETVANTFYRQIERIAGDQGRPWLQSRAFVRKQDLRYAQLREAEPSPKLRYWFSRLQRGVFVYGESFARVVVVSLLIILIFGLLYPLGGWTSTIGPNGSTAPLTYARVAEDPVLLWRSVYHSAMMFATGNRYGGIEATTTLSQAITSVEALLGPTMLALVVFVLGRRAAR
jgi:uncharacterized protein YjbI with pentapeptide repeats